MLPQQHLEANPISCKCYFTNLDIAITVRLHIFLVVFTQKILLVNGP